MSCPLSVSRTYRVSSSVKPLSRTICQSAPPGSTLPLIPGPENVPPRIGTIRRRPCGTSPISTGGPTCARNSNPNVSSGPLMSLIMLYTNLMQSSGPDLLNYRPVCIEVLQSRSHVALGAAVCTLGKTRDRGLQERTARKTSIDSNGG